VETTVEQLDGNRVRLTVEVPSADVKHAVEHAASDLAGSLKIPGFRKGKVPLPVLISRVGKERLYSDAIESHIGGWFWNAAAGARVRPVEQPSYDYELPGSTSDSFRFTAEVPVQPKPDLPDWTTLEVPAAEADVPDDLVEHELNVLRSSVAELAPVEGRPAQAGDTVVVDIVDPDGEAQRDYVVELGAGRLLDEIEEGLAGMSVGETKPIELELADESTRAIDVTLKEVKEKVLPDLDDEFARESSEFATLGELRGDLEERLREQLAAEVDAAFRSAVVDKLIEGSKVEPEGPLVEARTRALLESLAASLERRGISLDTYLQVTGGSPDDLISRLREEAKQSVGADLVLEAAADQLGLEISDGELESELRERYTDVDDETIAQLKESDRWERERENLRLARALDRVAADVKRIPVELADARDKLWTPDKEKQASDTKLWTPASKERA
jgi:trigger factor